MNSLLKFRKTIGYGIPGIQKKFVKPFVQDGDLNDAMRQALPFVLNFHNPKNKQTQVQKNILQFYDKHTITPYIPLCAKGPWIITETGAIVYDVGGYGMLGFGHAPDWATEILAKPHVMTNIMTPQRIHKAFTEKLQENIGVHQYNECPYTHFAFLNSGSECVELAIRITDLQTSLETDAHALKNNNAFLTLRNGFHGRTSMAARLSNSSLFNYQNHLQTFHNDDIYTVDINDCHQFFETFYELHNKRRVQAVIMEPVMGEGNPGIQINKDFYTVVRNLTKKHNAQFIIDSVQAGIRTNGYLSVIDYPDLEGIDPPDIEIFSKIIHSGQYPLSVLATTQKNKDLYKTGIYGNTMTGNPKALEIGYETLARVNEHVIENVQHQGINFKKMLQEIQSMFPHLVRHISGKGLLLAMHIHTDYRVDSNKGLEYICRSNGLNVIHGGDNAIRFTPHLQIDESEIHLIRNILIQSLNMLAKDD